MAAEIRDNDIRILYVEDEEIVLDYWLSYIRKTWSPQSEGARSAERAGNLLERRRARFSGVYRFHARPVPAYV